MYQVLLADDETIFLEFMQSIVDWEKYGCDEPVWRKDGEAAFEYIIKEAPEIAFVDISMPRMDGIEVCRKVRESGMKTKLIIMTGHDEFSFAYQAIKIGIDDYLLKPFSRTEVEKTLEKTIRGMGQDSRIGEPDATFLSSLDDGATKYEIMAQMINEYLEKHYRNRELSMSKIEEDLGFAGSYLRRVYKLTCGITIMQQLEAIRMERAKLLLTNGRYQNQEIAQMTGFSDPYYFSRRFKQLNGMTPTEYRGIQEEKNCGNDG